MNDEDKMANQLKHNAGHLDFYSRGRQIPVEEALFTGQSGPSLCDPARNMLPGPVKAELKAPLHKPSTSEALLPEILLLTLNISWSRTQSPQSPSHEAPTSRIAPGRHQLPGPPLMCAPSLR